jgi:hypothetical protein
MILVASPIDGAILHADTRGRIRRKMKTLKGQPASRSCGAGSWIVAVAGGCLLPVPVAHALLLVPVLVLVLSLLVLVPLPALVLVLVLLANTGTTGSGSDECCARLFSRLFGQSIVLVVLYW